MPDELPEELVDKLKTLIEQLQAGTGPGGAAPGEGGEVQLTIRPGDPSVLWEVSYKTDAQVEK